jgi:hypothetical protein
MSRHVRILLDRGYKNLVRFYKLENQGVSGQTKSKIAQAQKKEKERLRRIDSNASSFSKEFY